MSEETVVAVFRTAGQADAALRDLHAVGIPDSALSRHASMETVAPQDDPSGVAFGTGPDAADDAEAEASHRRGFWERLFGGTDVPPGDHLDRRIRAGGVVVTVRTGGNHLDAVVEILERHDPDDIDEQVELTDIVAGGCTDHEPSLAERRDLGAGADADYPVARRRFVTVTPAKG